MTDNDRKYAIECINYQLENGYIDLGCHDKDELEVVREAMSALKVLEQIRWERDVATLQIEELGLSLGQKVDGMRIINVNKLTKSIEDKMTYMCGCRNCIETVTQIIKGERKPFDSQCDKCGNKDCESKNSN